MPERETLARARRDKRAGKAPTTQAGEFIREEMHHIREGKHGARSPQQAIAIGLSKARRAGVELAPPAAGTASSRTRRQAQRDYQRGHGARAGHVNPRRSAASLHALEDERRSSASEQELSAATRAAARRRGSASRSAAAQRAARTKGAAVRSGAAKKAARTRQTGTHARASQRRSAHAHSADR